MLLPRLSRHGRKTGPCLVQRTSQNITPALTLKLQVSARLFRCVDDHGCDAHENALSPFLLSLRFVAEQDLAQLDKSEETMMNPTPLRFQVKVPDGGVPGRRMQVHLPDGSLPSLHLTRGPSAALARGLALFLRNGTCSFSARSTA